MKWRVVKLIKVSLPGGETLRIEPGKIVDMPPYKAMRFVREGTLQFFDEPDTKSKEPGIYCQVCGDRLVLLGTLKLDQNNKHFIKIPVTASTVRPGDVRFDNSRHEAHRFCPNETIIEAK